MFWLLKAGEIEVGFDGRTFGRGDLNVDSAGGKLGGVEFEDYLGGSRTSPAHENAFPAHLPGLNFTCDRDAVNAAVLRHADPEPGQPVLGTTWGFAIAFGWSRRGVGETPGPVDEHAHDEEVGLLPVIDFGALGVVIRVGAGAQYGKEIRRAEFDGGHVRTLGGSGEAASVLFEEHRKFFGAGGAAEKISLADGLFAERVQIGCRGQ